MTPKVSLRKALEDPDLLGSALAGPTWHAWRVILFAAMGEPLTKDELKTFTSGIAFYWICLALAAGIAILFVLWSIFWINACAGAVAKVRRRLQLLHWQVTLP